MYTDEDRGTGAKPAPGFAAAVAAAFAVVVAFAPDDIGFIDCRCLGKLNREIAAKPHQFSVVSSPTRLR